MASFRKGLRGIIDIQHKLIASNDNLMKSAKSSASAFTRFFDLQRKFDPLTASLNDMQFEMDELKTAFDLGVISVDRYQAAMNGLEQKFRVTSSAISSFSKSAKESASIFQEKFDLEDKFKIDLPTEKLEREMVELTRAFDLGVISVDRYQAEMNGLEARLRPVEVGVQSVTKSARESASAFEEFSRLRSKFDPLAAATDRLERETRELKRAYDIGAISLTQYTDHLRILREGTDQTTTATVRAQRSNAGFMKGMSANRRIIQNVGFQISDLGVQIAGGQSALLSLTQNVPQVVQMFGAWGAILAGLITLIGTFAIVMTKSGKGLADVAGAFGIAETEVQSFITLMGKAKEAVFNGINVIVNNLDTLLITLGVIAGFMAGKYIAAFLRSSGVMRVFSLTLVATRRHGIAAGASMLYTRGAVVLLSKSLAFLKAALIQTGIGALIVGAGYLIERLFTLNKATGDWGTTFKLVGDVIMQTMQALPTFFLAAQLKQQAMAAAMTASFLSFLSKTSGAMPGWVNSIVAAMVSAGQSIGAVWEGLKGTIFNIMVSVANTVTSKMQKTVNGIIAAANIVPGVDIQPITEGFGQIKAVADTTLKGVGQRIDDIFVSNAKKKFVGKGGSIGEALIGSAAAAQKRADAFGTVADALFGKAKSAIPAWQQLTDLLNKADAGQHKFDIRDLFGGDKDKDKKTKKDPLTKELERVQADVKKAIGALGATFADANIDFSIDRIRTNIAKLSDIPAPRMAHILTEVEAIRGRIKSLAAPIQAEKAKLDAILSSDLKTINPDKFMADTLEITTRIQEMTQPIRTEIAAINALDPRLNAVDTDFFDQSLTDSVNKARTQMDRIRGVVGEIHNIPAIKLPKIDTTPIKQQISGLMAFVQDLGRTVSNSIRTNMKGLITGTKSLKDALGNVLDTIASKIADFAIDSLFKNVGSLFGSGAGGGGGLLSSFFGSVFSFDGGGFTGQGSRSGGVDGKGGFPAILHPNETVVDHTKTQRNPNRGDMSNLAMGYSGGGQSAPVTITNQNYFNGVTREEVMRDVEASQKQMKRQIENEMPSHINKHRFNQNRGVA